MRTHTTTLRFDRDLTADEQELVSLLGWQAGLALGVPVTIEWRPIAWEARQPVKFEPFKHDDAAGFEERVAVEMDHLQFYTGLHSADVVQVECGRDEWREEDRRRMAYQRFCLPDWKRVAFGERVGHYVGRVRDIPLVVVPDGGKPVLRPRWPETNWLVTGLPRIRAGSSDRL